MKTATTVLLFALLSATAQGEDITSHSADWASQEIDLSALKAWGTKRYTYSVREPGGKTANALGTVSLSTEFTDDTVVLKDSYQMTHRGEKLSLAITHTCRKDNFLSPTRIESKGEGSDELGTFVATIAEGKAEIRTQDGRESVRDLPDGTITMAAMMRLVTLVSKTPGKSFSYRYSLESEELNLKQNYRLEVLPPEKITSGGRQVQCSKIRLSGGGISPVYYWITENGVLLRLMMDDRKIIELKDAA